MQDDRLPEAQRQQMADAAMRTFHHWGDAETNYATQSAQMAKKWQDFEADGDSYLLQYRTANDEKVRDEHQKLHGITLPVHDDFWKEYYPPLGWNCRCTVVQVPRDKYPVSNSLEAISAGLDATKNTPSFRFNPGIEKKAFPEGVSYLKRGGKKAETACQALDRTALKATAKTHPLLDQTTECTIQGETHAVKFRDFSIGEYAEKMYGNKNYWLKNAILEQMPSYIRTAVWYKSEEPDLSHNTGATLRLKRKFKFFHYFNATLPNGEPFVIELVEYQNGEFVLYTAVRQHI